MADLTPPPPYPYGENLSSQTIVSGKDLKTFHFLPASSNSLNDPHGKQWQKQTAITMEKKEKDALEEWIVKANKQHSSLIVISLCTVGLLFLVIMQTRAIHQLNRNHWEEIKSKDAEVAFWKQKYEKDREMRIRMVISSGLVKRVTEFQVHKNTENQERTTFEERIVKINGVGRDGLFGFTRTNKEGIIVKVEKGWPAEAAGMRLGDQIVTIEGVSYSETSIEALDDLFNSTYEKGSITLVLRYNPECLKELGYSANP